MINWNRSPVSICLGLLGMILWRTGEKRLCKWDEDGHYSWSVVLTRLLWLKYRQNVIDPQSCIVEQALASPLQCTFGNNWKSMQTEPPVNTCCGNSLWHQLGCFFAVPWPVGMHGIKPDLSDTGYMHSSLCGFTGAVYRYISYWRNTVVCRCIDPEEVTHKATHLVLLYRAFPLCKVKPVLHVCLHLLSMFLHIQFARQIE